MSIVVIRPIPSTKITPSGLWVKFFENGDGKAFEHIQDGDYLLSNTDVTFVKKESIYLIRWARTMIAMGIAEKIE